MENKLRERRYALILAGGRSRRMGGNKALLRLEKRTETLLERAVRFWRESGAAEKIFVAAGQPGYLPDLPEGAEPIYDLIEDGGPMAGLLSAFRKTDAGLFYLSAVDMPYLCREAIPPVPLAECDASVYLLNGRPGAAVWHLPQERRGCSGTSFIFREREDVLFCWMQYTQSICRRRKR